jgi:alginate O-acetyltransferase complex protein AlgI
MAFSSNIFLFCFLPAVLALHYAVPRSWRNGVLLLASLLFYGFDAGWMIWLLLVSILINYTGAKAIAAASGSRRRMLFGVVVVLNLIFLLYYKYADFLWQLVRDGSHLIGVALGVAPAIPLPIGISFFTFQAISYIADVNAKQVVPARRLVDFGMYHALFPQLIAGPIVRYVEIERMVYDRSWSVERAADGAFRFCLGLGKKLILADTNGRLADSVFALPGDERTAAIAWLGIAAYTLQIYFDFSGYSDMAIGLGKLLGFDFPENFNMPYRSRSITEFWRRWHMTLSRWFRDYLYIPLGGNRAGAAATYRNLIIVFFLCGLWHGAGLTFIAWGLWQGLWLIIERMYRNRWGELPRGFGMWVATFAITMLGWVLFRARDVGQALSYFAALFGLNHVGTVYYGWPYFATPYNMFFVVLGFFFALGPFEGVSWQRLGSTPAAVYTKGFAAIAIFVYATIMLSANSFNPFIYFRF